MLKKLICKLFSLILFILLFNGSAAYGQKHTGIYISDTTSQSYHSPMKATLLSAALPGLGQAYNQKYWKIPLVYAGYGALAYFANYHNNLYHKYLDHYLAYINDEPDIIELYGEGKSDVLQRQKERFRRYRDLVFISMGALYIINIIDANVDAHLFYFDINEDLTLNIQPQINPFPGNLYSPMQQTTANWGIKCSFNLKSF